MWRDFRSLGIGTERAVRCFKPKGLGFAAFIGVLGVIIAITGSLQGAERPELTRVFPAGGQAGTVVAVEATGKFPVWPIQAWSDTELIQWSFEETSGKLKATIDANAKPGLHWLRLYHPNGATSARPFLIGNAVEQVEVEPNNRVAEANVVASLPASFQGVLGKRGDVDLVSIALVAGQKIVATVDAATMLRSPLDASLQILDAGGFVVAENMDRFGLDPSLEFTPTKDGKYFVRVFGFPTTPDSTIAFGGGADWIYRLRLEKGDDPVFNRWQPSQLERLSLQTVAPDEANAMDSPLGIELPAWLHGTIAQPGLQKFFRFKGAAGQQYRMQLVAREIGSELDATLAIWDKAGKQQSQQDDVGNERDPDLIWKAPADGEYVIAVKDFHLGGGPGYDFNLLVMVLLPDFKLSVSSDLIQAVVGKEIELQVKLEREAEFAGEIEVGLHGAPEGVECPVVKSIHGTDTAKKVTLRIKSSAPFQGPIQVSARTSDGEKVRFAQVEDGKPMWFSIVAE